MQIIVSRRITNEQRTNRACSHSRTFPNLVGVIEFLKNNWLQELPANHEGMAVTPLEHQHYALIKEVWYHAA
jgi:hypothetical protein